MARWRRLKGPVEAAERPRGSGSDRATLTSSAPAPLHRWVIEMKLHHKPEPDPEFRYIHPVKATLLRIWGPADSWDNPLSGTRYDPALQPDRQHDNLEMRQARWERRKQQWNTRTHSHHANHKL